MGLAHREPELPAHGWQVGEAQGPTVANHVGVYAHMVTLQGVTGNIKILSYVGSAMAGTLGKENGPDPLASQMAYYDKVITRAPGWEKVCVVAIAVSLSRIICRLSSI